VPAKASHYKSNCPKLQNSQQAKYLVKEFMKRYELRKIPAAKKITASYCLNPCTQKVWAG
jgi:hypothetical protein